MNYTLREIKTLLVQIEKTNEILKQFTSNSDETDMVVSRQYLRKKHSLVKELIATLVQSPIDVKYYEKLLSNAMYSLTI